MNIHYNLDNPYGEVISRYLQTKFPKVANISNTDLLEILSDIIIGTKETRYGPVPSPETLVNVRAVIRDAISKSLPIPMLVPWGGRKTNPVSSIDIAELSGLYQLIHLDENIKKFYEPGLLISINVEDTGAKWIYRNDPDVVKQVVNYSDCFENLAEMVKGETNLIIARESRFVDEKLYFVRTQEISNLLFKYITFSDRFPDRRSEELKPLLDIGWKGTISTLQRDYYRDRYKSLYPEMSDYEATKALSDYFASSKVRYDFGAKGIPKSEVKGYIQINFTSKVPGTPDGMFSTSVYRRTVSISDGRTHIAPWRAKGYLRIDEQTNEVKMKVTSWNDPILRNLEEFKLEISYEGMTIDLESDYLIS